LKDFLRWKNQAGELMDAEAPLLLSYKGGQFSLRGIEYLAKRLMSGAGLDSRYSIHSLRHSTAVHLLRKTKNLRLVQKVLRHASITTGDGARWRGHQAFSLGRDRYGYSARDRIGRQN
jgi:site-specific recombinase XerD